MSTNTLSSYFVPCLTEGIQIVSDYVSTVPTTCPHDVSHQIDSSNIILCDTITPELVYVNQNSSIPTGGYFRIDGYTVTTPANSTSTTDIVYPYNISGYSVILMPTTDNIGDMCNFVAIPNTPVGILTADISVGATTLSIGSVAPLNPGFFLSITDGTNTADLGEIISLDIINNVITFSTPSTFDFSTSSPSIVKITIPRVKNFKFITNDTVPLGASKIGSSGLSAGQVVRVLYTNNGDHEKTFFFYTELEC